jgi:hypothetical protein
MDSSDPRPQEGPGLRIGAILELRREGIFELRRSKETKFNPVLLRFFAAKAAKHVLPVSSQKRWNYSSS